MSFFLILAKKNSQVCRYCNLIVQMKNVKKKLLNKCFFVSFGLWQKNLYFYTNVFGRVVKTTFYVSRGTLSEQNFWKEVLKTSGLLDSFWNFRDKGGKIFQGLQNSKRCPGEQLKKVFIERKSRFFSDSERLSYFWRKALPDLRNPQSENAMK